MRHLIHLLVGVLVVSGGCREQTEKSEPARVEPSAPATAQEEPAADALITKQSAHSVDETIERYEAALKERGLTIFTRLDHAAAAKSAELDMPRATVIVFGNPRAGTPVFLKAPTAAIDLPLRALVWEDAEGAVFLSYNSAKHVFGSIHERHGAPYNEQAVAKLEGALAAVADQAVK